MSILKSLPAVKNDQTKRLGRGYGSGKGGHTSSRGQKGHNSRTGGGVPLWFEGGQLPIIRRLPWQRGKGRLVSLDKSQEVQLRTIVSRKLTMVDIDSLKAAGLIDNQAQGAKVIGPMKLEEAYTLRGVAVTAGVRQAIEAAGGKVEA